MNRRFVALLARSFAISLFTVAAACSDDDDPSGPSSVLEGTWEVASFTGLGQDFIQLGMDVTIDIDATSETEGTYDIAFVNDQVGACDPGPDCTQSGDWTATSSTISLEDGEDVTTFNYTRSGANMTWTGAIDGTPVTIVMAKVD